MDTLEFLKLILPGLIAVIGNLIFYIIVKNRIDKSIEKYKIAYLGVFKEKTEVYKSILQKSYDLRNSVYHYQFDKDPDKLKEEIHKEFNDFIRFYSINRTFISSSILQYLKDIKFQLESVFTSFNEVGYMKSRQLTKEESNRITNGFFEASAKIRNNNPDNPFLILEEKIIEEIRSELFKK